MASQQEARVFLYVSNIPHVDNDAFRAHFTIKHGGISVPPKWQSIVLYYIDPSSSFARIEYEDKGAQDQAMRQLNGSQINGSKISISEVRIRPLPKAEKISSCSEGGSQGGSQGGWFWSNFADSGTVIAN